MRIGPLFLLSLPAFLASCATNLRSAHFMNSALENSSRKDVPQTVILDGIWGPHVQWEPLRRKVEKQIGPCRIWHYNNSGGVSLETLGRALASDLRALDAPLNIVGFSMGGLVVREAMRQDPDIPLQKAVLLNCPHDGSLFAHFLPLPACRDMRPRSAFLQRLKAAPWTYPTLVTWCPADLMVVPGVSARWKSATTVLRSDVPLHAWPVFSRGIHCRVMEFLAMPTPS